MKLHLHPSAGFIAAGIFLLTGTLAYAQAAQASGTTARANAGTVVHGRDASTGMASGRQDQFGHASGLATGSSNSGAQSTGKSPVSAHATESLRKKHIANVKYNDRAAAPAGAAPNAEPDKMAIKENGIGKSTASASHVISYKDPEDMTTRYRPGNNKTTRSSSEAPPANNLNTRQK